MSGPLKRIDPTGLAGFLNNLVPVTIGKVIGGAGGGALTYRVAYRPNGV